MSPRCFIATATLAAFLSAVAVPAAAQGQAPQASPLRASIDRAASKDAQSRQLPQRKSAPVRKAAMQGGGGGGMMVMTLIGTVAGLAATYFVVKEMRKQTDAATTPAQ